MEAREFMKLAGELDLTTLSSGQSLRGPARDISRFLHAGDPEVDHLFLGVYGAMMAAGLDRVHIELGDKGLADQVMNSTRVRLTITAESLTLERLPIGEEQNDE